MASQNYVSSKGTLHEESLSFLFIICSHQPGKKLRNIAKLLKDKWDQANYDILLHFHPDSCHASLIPLQNEQYELILKDTSELTQVTKIPESFETFLFSKSGKIRVFENIAKEKTQKIVKEVAASKIERLIYVDDIENEKSDADSDLEESVSLQNKSVIGINSRSEKKRKKEVKKSFLLVYFSQQQKQSRRVQWKPPNSEEFSVAEKNKNATVLRKKKNQKKNVLNRNSWHLGDNKCKLTVWKSTVDDSERRENYFLEDKTVSVSPNKVSRKGKYSPSLIRHLRDVTNLPLNERLSGITVLAFPAKKGKYNKSAQRRTRTHNSQAQEGIPDQYPTPVSDGSGSLDQPPSELVQTSSGTIFQSFTRITPTTNLMPSVDAERSLVSRIRGELPESRFSCPEQPPRHPQYTDQPSRQRSFTNWPSTTGQDSTRMAIYGFFYTGRFDLIRCFHCGIGLKDWASTDEPLFEHIKHSPTCPFLKQLLGQDLLNAYRDNLLANQLPPSGRSSEASTGNVGATSGRVRNPQYTDLEARKKSFDKWPASSLQRPEVLADAGLFYTGFNDLCRCFTCDGGLQRWDADDDPWIEHARWFPHCTYVRQVKGQDYINMVQQAAARAREEEEDPAVIFPPPGQNRRRGPVEQGLENLTLEDTGFNVLKNSSGNKRENMRKNLEQFFVNKQRLAKESEILDLLYNSTYDTIVFVYALPFGVIPVPYEARYEHFRLSTFGRGRDLNLVQGVVMQLAREGFFCDITGSVVCYSCAHVITPNNLNHGLQHIRRILQNHMCPMEDNVPIRQYGIDCAQLLGSASAITPSGQPYQGHGVVQQNRLQPGAPYDRIVTSLTSFDQQNRLSHVNLASQGNAAQGYIDRSLNEVNEQEMETREVANIGPLDEGVSLQGAEPTCNVGGHSAEGTSHQGSTTHYSAMPQNGRPCTAYGMKTTSLTGKRNREQCYWSQMECDRQGASGIEDGKGNQNGTHDPVESSVNHPDNLELEHTFVRVGFSSHSFREAVRRLRNRRETIDYDSVMRELEHIGAHPE